MEQVLQSAKEAYINKTKSYAILDFDEKYFCKSASITQEQKEDIIKQLLDKFCGNEEATKNEETEENSGKFTLSPNYMAGIFLYDLVQSGWPGLQDLPEEQLEEMKSKVLDLEFEDYAMRNVQARILSHFLEVEYLSTVALQQEETNEKVNEELLEPYLDKISQGESASIDTGLRCLIFFLEQLEDANQTQDFHSYVDQILPVLFSAFTNEEIGTRGREQILHLFFLVIRTITWADGIDNQLIEDCLNESFNNWMALFLQIIQSNPREYFGIKRNALKCLTVIFRDLINYSRECINMILKPAWKLLNQHLPVFTQVVGYDESIQSLQEDQEEDEDEEKEDDLEQGYESFDDQEIYGVEGMTMHLLELLTTLVQRPNVQEVVKQGLVPLVTTVSSYMIIQHNRERQHYSDNTFFIADKTQDLLQSATIKSQTLQLTSNLIEVFGDNAVEAILYVIENLFLQTESTVMDGSSPLKLQIRKEQQEEEEVKEPQNIESRSEGDIPAQQFAVETVNLQEYSYNSPNKKHYWKKREVALLLIGTFSEDFAMYKVRNPNYDMMSLFTEVLKTDFDKALLKSYLKGRSLWCASLIAEQIPVHPAGVSDHIIVKILDLAIDALKNDKSISVKLIATRCLIKYCRRFSKDQLIEKASKFEQILDDLLALLDQASLDCVYLPIEAFSTFSKINEQTVAQMTPKVMPKLLSLFQNYHSEGALGQELISLFKLWCHYDQCRDIFVNTFIPFIMKIVDQYYQSTPNVDNKDSILKMQQKDEEETKDNESTNQNIISVVDSSILQHVLDLLCSLLKNTKPSEEQEIKKIVSVFPDLLTYVEKSDDMFLLLNGTTAIKTFIHLASQQILTVTTPERIISVTKKLLSPQTNEQAARCLGNLVIQIFHKIQPKIDTALLMCVVWKTYKSRMPSIVQSLALIFARLIHTNPKEIVGFLQETSIDNRLSLKIVLDKWLLQQPLFRGYYTRNVTLSALIKLFLMKDSRIESLMVIGYNPSHSNINSEVNAPFKMLSLLLRFLENESIPTKIRKPNTVPDYEEEQKDSAFGQGYTMKRNLLEQQDNQDYSGGQGERLDTIDGCDGDDYLDGGNNNDDNDRIDVDLDDLQDDDGSDEDALSMGPQNSSTTGSGSNSGNNLFDVGKSNDKGLADMETGSEVYMSELLAGFDMDDFDEADEMNEEDLQELNDEFAKINLKKFVQESLNDFMKNDEQGSKYVSYCVRQLPKADQDLAKKFLNMDQKYLNSNQNTVTK